MVLDAYRHVADAILNPVARRMTVVSPDALSWAALGFAAAGGVAFFRGGALMLSLGALFVFLNALFDALDGKVAKLRGTASRRGDFLDHVLDRYADVLILGGIALNPGYCPTWLGLLALLGVLLTSYMGTQAQAVGAGRHYGGALGRADRLVIVVVVAALQAGLDPMALGPVGFPPARFTYLGWAMALFAVLGHVTAVQRAVATWRHLS